MSAANFLQSNDAAIPVSSFENRTHPERDVPYMGPAYRYSYTEIIAK